MRPLVARMVLIALVAALAGCDQASKRAAEEGLRSGGPQGIAGGVAELLYTENRDVAFNLLRWIPPGARQPLMLASQSLGVLALSVLLLRRRGLDALALGFALALAGALGNLLDRALRGYVVDFIHVHPWPVFNLADVWISVGVGLVVLATLRFRVA